MQAIISFRKGIEASATLLPGDESDDETTQIVISDGTTLTVHLFTSDLHRLAAELAALDYARTHSRRLGAR